MVTLRHPRQLTVEVAADFRSLAGLREQLRIWLDDGQAPERVVHDVLLVATELGANAIEAGAGDLPVEVTATNDGEAVRLAVANHAAEAEPPLDGIDELRVGSLQARGRGLAIVRALADTVTMSSADGRTVIRTMQLL